MLQDIRRDGSMPTPWKRRNTGSERTNPPKWMFRIERKSAEPVV